MQKKFMIMLAFLCFTLLNTSITMSGALDKYYVKSTVLISHKLNNGKTEYGTGFMVYKKVNDMGGHIYLVTNRHVVPELNGSKEINVRINVSKDNKLNITELPIAITGSDNVYLPIVKFHPSVDYDIAAINITKVINDNKIVGAWIPYELFATKKMMREEEITVGSEIFLLGYPDGIYDPRNPFPILRKGIIATVPVDGYSFNSQLRNKYKLPEHIDGFLIDANVFPGSSGSVVILKQQPNPIGFRGAYSGKGPKNIPYVLGIVFGSIPIDDYALHSTQRMGLGIAHSAEAIMETIDQYYR